MRHLLTAALLMSLALPLAAGPAAPASPAAPAAPALDLAKTENRKIEAWLKAGGTNPAGETLGVNSLHWTRNGRPWLPVMGEFHYARYPHALWEEQILKMKAAGISIVSTYVFWVNTEHPRGSWDWSGDNDLRGFIRLCQKHGLYVWLRPGPYINAEAKNGGLPDWANQNGKRSDAPWYLAEVARYYAEVGAQTRGLFHKDGGPIIGLQVDNEFAHGDARHLGTLLAMAQKEGMRAPFNTCTNNSKHDYPRGDLLPLQGAYPYRGWGGGPTTDYLFSSDAWNAMQNIGGLPYDGERFPRGMAELGVACWQGYRDRFIVPVWDSEGHLQNCIGRGVNLAGYYMFQGGTQKEGTQGGGHPLTYDFQAPLGEYGQARPSYHALKLIHHFLNDFGQDLAVMQPVQPDNPVRDPRDTDRLRYVGRFKGDRGFVFLSTCQCWVETKPKKDVQIAIKTSKGTLMFPEHPFTLGANKSPIFPINMDLAGVNLLYATAQPLCRVEHDGVPHVFFFAVDGVAPEFAVDSATAAKVSGPAARTDHDGRTVLKPEPGLGQAFTVTAQDGRRTVVVLLTRRQAEQSWRLKFRGSERLFLSDANLLADLHRLELASREPAMNLRCFPPLSGDIHGRAPVAEGLFSRHALSVPQAEPALSITRTSPQSCDIRFNALPAGVKDAWLRVDYTGSSADLLLDGQKRSDDRCNGAGWDIGLRRFMDGRDHVLTVKAAKWDDGVHGIAPAGRPATDAERQGAVRSVSAAPEYAVSVDE